MTTSRTGPGILSRAAGLRRFQIGRSIPCSRCQYDLRGLDLVGRCPECGASVESSIEDYLPGRGADRKSDRFNSGLQIIAAGWAVNGIIVVGCLFMPLALLASVGGALARILAFGRLRAAVDIVPGGPPGGSHAPVIYASITFVIGALLLSLFLGGYRHVNVVMTFYLLALGFEGFAWMSWLSGSAERLECPIVGPVGRIARWCWALLLPAAILSAAAPMLVIPGFGIYLAGAAVLLIVLVVFGCSLVTTLVTNGFGDMILQLELFDELSESTLVAVGSMSQQGQEVEPETPLEVAEGSDEEIRVSESALLQKESPEPGPHERDDNEPDTPMGVY